MISTVLGIKTEWAQLTNTCLMAKVFAKEKPGLYGGRYVIRIEGEDELFDVLTHDDPDRITDEDVVAHVTPNKVYAVGRARNYLHEDGSVWINRTED